MTTIEELKEKIEKLDVDIKMLLIVHRTLMDVYATKGTHEAKQRVSQAMDKAADLKRRKHELKSQLAALESNQPPPEAN